MSHARPPLPYADDIETIPTDEAEDVQQVVAALEVLLSRSQAKSGQFRGDVHVKTHGYAHGEFRVLPIRSVRCRSRCNNLTLMTSVRVRRDSGKSDVWSLDSITRWL